MDTILDNTLGENYFDTRALADFVSVCHHRCQQGVREEFGVGAGLSVLSLSTACTLADPSSI